MKNYFLSISRTTLLTSFLSIFNFINAQVPVADFKVCKKIIEIYTTLDLYDLSTNNPTSWEWDVLDSSGKNSAIMSGDVYTDANGNGNNEFSKNPQIGFSATGCYTIKLTSKNANGFSTPVIKYCVVEVIDLMIYYPGFGTYGPPKWENNVTSEYGEIWDNGGPNNNYTNNQDLGTKSFLKITPSNGVKITINFSQIKLADDTLFLYDADTVNNSKILAKLTSANNGTTPTFVTTAGKMYFIFKSNGALTDSGYHAIYYTTQNPLLPLNQQINIVKNQINSPSIFVNSNPTIMAKNHTRQWYVNDTLQAAYTDKDTMLHTFYNTATYKICIIISNCDTTYSNCINNNNHTGFGTQYLNDLIIFPNPTSNILQIKNSNLIRGTITMMNSMGEILYEKSDISNESNIEMSNYPEGIYMLKVSDASGFVKTFKVIKN